MLPKRNRRKSGIDSKASNKRQRSENNSGAHLNETTKVLVTGGKWKKDSNEQQRLNQAPTTQRSCVLSRSRSEPAASKQDNGNQSGSTAATGEMFDSKYIQLQLLGEGAFGSVYAGYRRSDHLPVAIKHIPKEKVETHPLILNGNMHDVPLEVIMMMKARHSRNSAGTAAVVSLQNWYSLDEEYILVMERPVPSVDLFTYVQDKGSLTEEEAKDIMKQLVDAIVSMHSAGVFHRDIKLENILVETGSRRPHVRIIDFGSSTMVRDKPYHGYSGTIQHAPPEYHVCKTYRAGPATVWQLGALLLEMLDERISFNTMDFLNQKEDFNSKLSQECQRFLRICLEVEPRKRATFEQMQLHPWLSLSP